MPPTWRFWPLALVLTLLSLLLACVIYQGWRNLSPCYRRDGKWHGMFSAGRYSALDDNAAAAAAGGGEDGAQEPLLSRDSI